MLALSWAGVGTGAALAGVETAPAPCDTAGVFTTVAAADVAGEGVVRAGVVKDCAVATSPRRPGLEEALLGAYAAWEGAGAVEV